MVKKTLLLLLSAVSVTLSADPVVVRRDFDIPASWKYPDIMGRDFWFMLPQNLSNNVDLSMQYGVFRNPALQKVPAFINAGIRQGAYKKQAMIPKDFVLKDLFYAKGNPWWNMLEKYPKKHVPLMLNLGAGRPSYLLRDNYKHNAADYQDYLKRHPNFYMFSSLGEWDNELVFYDNYLTKRMPQEERAKLLRRYPRPKDRYAHLEMAKRIFDRGVNFNFNDKSRISALRAGWALDHVAASFGARMLSLETTNTSRSLASYRWQTSAYFIRGAARQFNVPWQWYVAHYYNGYDSKGKWRHHYMLNYKQSNQYATSGPFFGPSPSNMKRVNWMTWLYGASFHALEAAPSALTVLNSKTGVVDLSKIGHEYNDLYLVTRKLDRGVPYTPVALLVPIAQGYPQGGGRAWSRYPYQPGDMMVDGFTFSIVPPGGNRLVEMKKGVESTLFNTPYAAAYDVLAPDSTQKTADFVRALNAYKAAFLTGFYKKGTDLQTPLAAYVRNGGTLFLNAAQIPGFFNSELTGVKVSAKAFSAGKFIIDENKKKTALKDAYRIRKLTLAGAKPWLRDEKGNILAAAFRYGKGKVIVTAPEWMAPPLKKNIINNIYTGKQQFEFIKYILSRVQDEVYPVKARIPVQYGINKTKNGWLLWLINNKGVYKFVDQPAVVKAEERITVPVELRSLAKLKAVDGLTGKRLPIKKGILNVTVEAGDLRVIKLVP